MVLVASSLPSAPEPARKERLVPMASNSSMKMMHCDVAHPPRLSESDATHSSQHDDASSCCAGEVQHACCVFKIILPTGPNAFHLVIHKLSSEF